MADAAASFGAVSVKHSVSIRIYKSASLEFNPPLTYL